MNGKLWSSKREQFKLWFFIACDVFYFNSKIEWKDRPFSYRYLMEKSRVVRKSEDSNLILKKPFNRQNPIFAIISNHFRDR